MVTSTLVQPTFANLQEFELFVRDNFINGSGISPELFDAAVEFHQDVEITDGMDAETPIHDELGWHFTRFGHQCRDPLYAAFLRNEDGSLWQAVVNIPNGDKPYSYLAPKGNGDRAFSPPVPQSLREKINKNLKLDIPLDGSFWDYVKSSPKIKKIILTEGGKKSLATLSAGLISISLYGNSSGKPKDKDVLIDDLMPLVGNYNQFLIGFDQDSQLDTIEKTKKYAIALQNRIIINGSVAGILAWDNSLGKGLDDLLVNRGGEFLNQLVAETELHTTIEYRNNQGGFNSVAFKILYGKYPHISFDGNIYRWNETHYEQLDPDREKSRILDYCRKVQITTKKGEIVFPFDTPQTVKNLYEYACMRFATGRNSLPKNSINCTNGVLTFTWLEKDLQLKFESHNPNKHYFTDQPIISYDSTANSQYADQLLSCLDAPQREILIKTLGASLDVATVRKYQGRNLKILFAIGQGQNGKDSINKVVSLIYQGKGTTSYSIDDFIDYDKGNKSAIAGLINSRVNWPSESGRTTRIDNSVSLKCLATGDTLISRYLYKDGLEYSPNCIGIFNLNEFPNIYATGEAAKSRYSFLHFAKTYVSNPTKANELKADPRFHDDNDWVIKEVAPAFLNYMIDGLQRMVKEGIDHSCNAQILQNIQNSNNHLFEFCQEMNVNYQEGATVKSKDLMALLKQFYIDNDIVQIDDMGRETFSDPVKPSDKYIKNTNQLNPRILEIFPKAEITKEYDPVSKRKIPVFKNISIGMVENTESSTKIPAPPAPPPHHHPHHETTIYQETRTTRTTFDKLSFEEKNNDPTSINTYPINQDLKIETPEISHTEKLGEKWCGGAGIPANKGFCGAGGGAGGAGTSVPIPPEPIYEEGDRIICYPTMQHESNGWKVKATIDSIEYEQGYMLTCTVSYKNQKKEDKTAVIGGANCDWLLGKV
ncbi:DUF3854 domain-containing protein [Aphanizomenon flos-aquae]|uniref:DUF3854 domain-containing protein n=1 Tax=Aphanizomenon flos-aquae FACHB-1040 TaxID=2692887 RepID=A0ABR8C4M5_APHFL|nr:DUF3854 domain-containing protein [Aphanizomenon flos-aquae]MBD2281395.1 DUF3854 domain-containing protein [Aphanizomenon flos-aquae FACHB-1040]